MKLIAFDIETWGLKPGYTLQPWRVASKESGILSIASFDGETEKVSRFKPPLVEVKNFLRGLPKQSILCGWNLKFDLSFLLAIDCETILKKHVFLDGMLLLKRLGYNLKSYGLKQSLNYFSDKIDFEKNYNSDVEFKIGNPKKVYSSEEQTAMLKYNIQDAVYTQRLIKYLASKAPSRVLAQAVRESTAAFLFANAWQRGILIDEKALYDCSDKVTAKCNNLELLCNKVDLSSTIISSPQQLQTYIRNELGLPLTERTPRGSFSVSSKVLKNLYLRSGGRAQQIIRLIIRYKEALTEKSKFIDSAIECVKESPLIHPDPIIGGTYTGRLTYSIYQRVKEPKLLKNGETRLIGKELKIGIPIHQIKKKGGIRKIFVAPKGHKLVELDFSAQEMRLIACIAKEKTMIKLFNGNKDMHSYTAAGIAGMSYEKFLELQATDSSKYTEMRFLGKLTNLSLQYRLSAKGLYRQWHDVYGLVDKTMSDAERARQAYLDLYCGIPQYWEQNIDTAQRQGYVENMAHRRCYLQKWGEEDAYKSSQTAINFPIQSTGADQKILALYVLKEFLEGNDIKLAWDLHDGLYFYVPDCMMQTDIIYEMVSILSNLPYESAWGWVPQVQFPVEAKIGDRWGDLKPL